MSEGNKNSNKQLFMETYECQTQSAFLVPVDADSWDTENCHYFSPGNKQVWSAIILTALNMHYMQHETP